MSTDRLSRLLSLVPWLRSRPGVRLDAAAEAFEVTTAELVRDLELLFCCGLPGQSPGDLIDIRWDDERIYVLDPQTLDRPLRLTADEACALTVAARALADVPGLAERDALERSLAKLAAAARTGSDNRAGAGGIAVALESQDIALATLRHAVQAGRRLTLRYLVESRDEITERDVDPLQVLLREGRFYLEGYCHRAEAVRLFRVDRVVEATELDVPADPPPGLVPRDLDAGLFQPAPDDCRVIVDLDPAARWVADYYPCEHVAELASGGLRVELRVADPSWVAALVLRLGGHGRVVEPAELREQVRRLATEALAGYPE